MVAEGVANIIVLVIDVSLVLISLRLLKEYRIDKLRTELFILRDQLFDHAVSGKISFSDPAYTTLRSNINTLLRFAHKVSFTRIMLSSMVIVKSSAGRKKTLEHTKKWETVLAGLEDEELRKYVKNLHEESIFTIIKHTALGGAIWLVIWMLVWVHVRLFNWLNLRFRSFSLSHSNGVELSAKFSQRLPAH